MPISTESYAAPRSGTPPPEFKDSVNIQIPNVIYTPPSKPADEVEDKEEVGPLPTEAPPSVRRRCCRAFGKGVTWTATAAMTELARRVEKASPQVMDESSLEMSSAVL